MNLSRWKSGIGGWLLMSAAIAELPPPELKRIPLQFASFSFYSENDKYFAGTDEDYTNGFKISAISAKRHATPRPPNSSPMIGPTRRGSTAACPSTLD